MSDPQNNERFNKRLNKILYVTMFTSYFFHMFAPLFWLGIAFLIAGIFVRVLLIVGVIFLLLDAVLSVLFIFRFKRMHSDHPEFERFRKAFNEGDPAGGLDKLTAEWAGDGFYTARIEGFREEAGSCKTVGEAFKTYKKHCLAIVTGRETFLVNLGLENNYFEDGGRYYVISFDRMREINDDIECHMYFDLLYDPEEIHLPKTTFSSEGLASTEVEGFFKTVEEFLIKNDLMNVPVGKTNIGTDE